MCYNKSVKRVRKEPKPKVKNLTRTHASNGRKWKKMFTTREFLNAVITSEMNTEMTEKAQALLASLDRKNSQRKAKPSKVAIANEPIKQAIVDYLTENGTKVASEVGVALNITTQKASALLRQLVEANVLKVEEVKVPKKGTLKAYSVQ